MGLLLQLRVNLGAADAAALSASAEPQVFYSIVIGMLVVILIAFAPGSLLVAMLLDDNEGHVM